jgi:hypothetical protein
VHGAHFGWHWRQLFGWWGGGGIEGTAKWLGSTGFRLPFLMAVLVALSESSGALLVVGVATPFVALTLAATMVVAVGTAHWKNGFWSGKGGYEFNLVLWFGCGRDRRDLGRRRLSTVMPFLDILGVCGRSSVRPTRPVRRCTARRSEPGSTFTSRVSLVST